MRQFSYCGMGWQKTTGFGLCLLRELPAKDRSLAATYPAGSDLFGNGSTTPLPTTENYNHNHYDDYNYHSTATQYTSAVLQYQKLIAREHDQFCFIGVPLYTCYLLFSMQYP